LFKIAVLISGDGSNLQAIIDNIESGKLNCEIAAVVSDREGAYGIERAKQHNIQTYVLDRRKYRDSLSDEILSIFKDKVDLIVLAGYLSILKGKILKDFKKKIINIHPSLLPEFGGKGLYGSKVHDCVLEAGVKVTGCTVHYVEEDIDAGEIILQKTVPVLKDDTAALIKERVLEQEHLALSQAIELIISNKKSLIKES